MSADISSTVRAIRGVRGGAPLVACAGDEHRLGTHGHDRGSARFMVNGHCDECGWSDSRPLCAGRVRDMLNGQGIRCAGCGRVYADALDFVLVEPLRRAEGVLVAVLDAAHAVAAFALHERARGFSEATIRNRLGCLGTLERATGRSLMDVDALAVVAYLGRSGIKASTRRTNQACIRAFFVFALAQKFRADDPTEGLEPVRVPKGEPRPFSREQIDAMLGSGAYRKTRAMILIGYYQGFRVSSIARVHGDDIDLLGGTIRTVGKGGKERTLPLHPVVAALAATMPANDWWFPARKDSITPMKSASVTNLITLAKKRAGITDPRLTPHSLRHSFATHLIDDGVDVRVIQELMMHDDLGSTQIYAGVSEQKKREGILALPNRDIPKHSQRRRAGVEPE